MKKDDDSDLPMVDAPSVEKRIGWRAPVKVPDSAILFLLLAALLISQYAGTSTYLTGIRHRLTETSGETASDEALILPHDDTEKDRPSFFTEHSVVIPGIGETTYRVPKTFDTENEDVQSLVVGVLSTAQRPHDRVKVRSSWASGYSNTFFLVAGDWTVELEEEFKEHNDLIYIARPEGYRLITLKVLVFLAAAREHLPHSAVMKTDDDTYVRMSEVIKLVDEHKGEPLYHGAHCGQKHVVRRPEDPWYVSREVLARDTYPNFAYGGGYVLSSSTNKCAVEKMWERNDAELSPVEDAFVGLLVEDCPGECTADGRFMTGSPARGHNEGKRQPEIINAKLVVHKLKSYELMMSMHDQACCNRTRLVRKMVNVTADPVSCANTLCPVRFTTAE